MLGLTLEGGGGKGAYHIGAWRAFKELGLDFNGVTGTSVGALNGALIVQEDFDAAWDIWWNISPDQVMDIDDKLYELLIQQQLPDNIHVFFDEVKKIAKGIGINTDPLQELIRNTLKEDILRASLKDFGFVTVCLTDRRPMEIHKEDVPYGKMAEYLMASSYLPIFQGKKLDGKTFIDGGFYDNLPIHMLYKKGYREVVAVRLLSRGRIRKIKTSDLKVTYITPKRKLGHMLDFTQKTARDNLTLGYLDTIRVFKNLKGIHYYIEGCIKDEEVLKFFMDLSDQQIKNIGTLLKLPQYISKNRLVLEGIIPKLTRLMGLDSNATYEDIYIHLLENIAAIQGIDSLRIYHLKELTGKIKRCEIQKKNTSAGKELIDEILLRVDKEKLLKEIISIILQDSEEASFIDK